jgi:chitinase
MLKRWYILSLGLMILIPFAAMTTRAEGTALPSHIIVGYWHNFDNGSGALKLANVSLAYDVIDVAFADYQGDGTFTFTPTATVYSASSQFKNDINLVHSRGQKVLLSLGGANAVIQLTSDTDIQHFVSTLTSIIQEYGFDGIDLDLEGTSLILNNGDTDFRAPTTPIIVNLIKAVNQLLAQFPGGLILSAAPETAYVQGGYGTYGSIYGAYLPVLHALRDKLTYVHVQDYNTGTMYGRDGSIYTPGTPDFLVAMADALVSGFRVDAFRETRNIFFAGLGADKVLIGIPATPDAAGSGFMPFAEVNKALDYLYTGKSFGGSYHLATPTGYPNFRGVMTWSINWDAYANLTWSTAYRSYLDALVTGIEEAAGNNQGSPGEFRLAQNFPNPFNPTTVVSSQLSVVSDVTIKIYDLLGREVATLVNERRAPGQYHDTFDATGLASGVYVYRMTAGAFVQSKTMVLLK